MTIRSILGAARRKALCSFYARTVSLGDRGPIISFTFDDFPRTALTVGARVLEDAGARGTYYVAFRLMGTHDELGEQFRVEDIHDLRDRGHELGSQTFSHWSCRSKSHSDYCQDVRRGLAAVREVTGQNCSNFSYPFGHVTLRTKKTLPAVVTSCRSVIPGLNGPIVDLALLRANRIYGERDQLRVAEQLIQENLKRRSWLIFYTHDIRQNPSPYGCTPALFEATVTAAARSGSRILAVEQVLRELGVKAQQPIRGAALAATALQDGSL